MSDSRNRLIKVKLTDDDVNEIALVAARNGVTVSDLISGFICDLVDGSRTNGSDERRLANEYLDRCGYSWGAGTFLTSLIDSGFLDTILEAIDDVQAFKDSDDPESQLYFNEAEAEIMAYYESYKEVYKDKAEPLEKGLNDVIRYSNDVNEIKGDFFLAALKGIYGAVAEEEHADEKQELIRHIRDVYKHLKESED